MNNRNITIDVLKGLGIIYVVFGHTLVNPMHDFIYLFHMPLFYFLSGYNYNEGYTLNPLSLIKKRLKALYLPFIAYELVFLLLHNIFYNLNLYSSKVTSSFGTVYPYSLIDYIKNIFRIITLQNTEQLLGAFWFFTVLITINIAFCLIRYFYHKILKIHNEIPFAATIILLYILGLALDFNNIQLPRNINLSLKAMLIFYTGFLFKNAEGKIPFNIILALISFVILCIGTIFGKSDILSPIYIRLFTYIVFALSGIYANIYIAKLILKMRYDSLVFIGKNTVVIMALHFFSFKIITLLEVYWFNLPTYMLAKFPVLYAENGLWIFYGIAGVGIPLILKKIGLYIKVFGNKIFFQKEATD